MRPSALGEDDKHISTVDAEGVALAAIQRSISSAREEEREIGAHPPGEGPQFFGNKCVKDLAHESKEPSGWSCVSKPACAPLR